MQFLHEVVDTTVVVDSETEAKHKQVLLRHASTSASYITVSRRAEAFFLRDAHNSPNREVDVLA